MIYTVTFNPALDYTIAVDNFQFGMTNRTSEEEILVGGKGINVSVVLRNLGFESTALGFVAGFTGDEVIKHLEEIGIRNGFIKLSEGFTRINIKIRNVEGTEINGMGPVIQKESVELLMNRLRMLQEGDILFLSGSIPPTIDSGIYQSIMAMLKDKGITIVVDAAKDLLVKVLEYKPFLIKPNNHELGEIFDVKLTKREEVVPYAKRLQQVGARNVLVSMAGEGAVLVAENGNIYEAAAPKGELINGVGAGDSMVAGFMAGWLNNNDYLGAFRMGIATGSASAFSKGLATKEKVYEILKTIL
ncbi:MAG: 1-phosphofructokinase [Lachnospiraceae bacterium]|nr:1-phosphofructokinase [Lachnospiraceae bacterium]